MAAALAASGGTVSASGLYTVTALFSNFLIRVCNTVFLPMLYAFLALAMVDAALRQDRLKGLQSLLGWGISTGLKAMMYIYTGFMALTGILSGSADAATLKAAKLTLSSVIPVVGGIISDAAETVLSSAGLLKSTIGTFGMLAVLGAFVTPFLRIGISYLSFKLTAALSAVLGSVHGRLLEGFTSAMGYLLAMTGSATPHEPAGLLLLSQGGAAMTAGIRGYLLAVAAAGILVSLAAALLPKGAVHRTGQFVGSLVLVLAVLSPVAQLDLPDMAKAISRARMEAREAVTGVETGNQEILIALIKEDCETYIWDKAVQMGLDVEVEVTVEDGVTYPYPTGVSITGSVPPAQQAVLSKWIEENLGIPEAQQEWIAM